MSDRGNTHVVKSANPRHVEGMRSLILVALPLLAVACFPKSAPPPTTITSADISVAQKKWPDATEASLNQGKDVFIANCNQCHDYPAMDAKSEAAWPATMDKMAAKAHLNPQQKQDVLRFVLTEEAR